MRFKVLILAIAFILKAPGIYAGTPEATHSEKVFWQRFPDGAAVKVHTPGNEAFARQVLEAAAFAYRTITESMDFSTPGYSFAVADRRYAHDPDRTIDVYIGKFKDAPCFDIIKLTDTQFQAVILLPDNYAEFIGNWERLNPSTLGRRDIGTDLKGTLIHEMLHVILFYYNKNLNKKPEAGPASRQNVDWYVEGLARYFETFAGARHDFFSQGFKQVLPDKIRFSRGGSNYFMRYPDQAFTHLRYENAIFWRFIDTRFGMRAIEQLSRYFRDNGEGGFDATLEKVTGVPFHELLRQFAKASLFRSFELNADASYLKEIARTRLLFRGGNLYLLDGQGRGKFLGKRCGTDWIGRWEELKALWEEPSVAGDATAESDVSPWATDFYEIQMDRASGPMPWLGVAHVEGGLPLETQIILIKKDGTAVERSIRGISQGQTSGLALGDEIRKEGLTARDIEKIFVLVTNTDSSKSARYEVHIA